MYEDNIRSFCKAMLFKLDQNRHKNGWSGCKMWWLRRRLQQEVGELERAIKAKASPDTILGEAADVANFCMMIAENYAKQRTPFGR